MSLREKLIADRLINDDARRPLLIAESLIGAGWIPHGEGWLSRNVIVKNANSPINRALQSCAFNPQIGARRKFEVETKPRRIMSWNLNGTNQRFGNQRAECLRKSRHL